MEACFSIDLKKMQSTLKEDMVFLKAGHEASKKAYEARVDFNNVKELTLFAFARYFVEY